MSALNISKVLEIGNGGVRIVNDKEPANILTGWITVQAEGQTGQRTEGICLPKTLVSLTLLSVYALADNLLILISQHAYTNIVIRLVFILALWLFMVITLIRLFSSLRQKNLFLATTFKLPMNEASQTFDQISGLIFEVSKQIEETAAAVEEVASSSEEILASIQEIESISIVNAEKSVVVQKASEQQTSMGKIIASHLENLAKTIQSLKGTVSNFI